ncbi:thioredoxin family protein [Methanobacterium spitsbergense]|uniref:Thioredoxin n=1 Tax=Methanobacterium spitsbergense TaxID=2874285 RepID=A0A8T5V0B9_9EURY|nr:thioredoxin family protein [Methanobacterium spitsbergense]MBZ2166429.1 thioredoxin family protein [Methanobacterium spitsbergense]
MKIIIYGTGCSKCKAVEKAVKEVVDKLGADAEIVKIEELDKILEAGILSTPALAIDNEIKVTGRIPTSSEIEKWIKAKM